MSTLYILNSWTTEDFHLIAPSIAHTCVNFSRFEKSRWRDKVAWKMARLLAQRAAACPALLRALRTKSILFSAIARPPLAPSSHLRMAKRHGRRASRSRRGIKDRLRRIDERENNRVRSQYTMGATMTREGNVRVRVRVLMRVSPERKPYRTDGNYIRAVKLSRRMHVHATRPAHTRARTRREIREKRRQWA